MTEEKKPEQKQMKPVLSKKWTFGIMGVIVAWCGFSWLFGNTGIGFAITVVLLGLYGLWKWEKSRSMIKEWWRKQREKKNKDKDSGI